MAKVLLDFITEAKNAIFTKLWDFCAFFKNLWDFCDYEQIC